jgi:hypothetical protein
MALVDAEEGYGPAVAVRRKGIELAGATIGAVAIAEFEAMDFPCGHCLLLRRDDTALPFLSMLLDCSRNAAPGSFGRMNWQARLTAAVFRKSPPFGERIPMTAIRLALARSR